MSEAQQPARYPGLRVDWRNGVCAALLKFGCGLGGAASVAGLGGGLSWVLDLGSHFQAQYFGFQLLCVTGFLLLKQYRWALLAVGFLAIPTFKLAPYYLAKPAPTGLTERLRVVSFNVLSSNLRHAETVAWVRQTDPDLAFFPEVTPVWAADLESLKSTMPHCIEHPQRDNFGLALFSKYPILEPELVDSRFLEVAMVRVVVEIAGRRVVFCGVHPLLPGSPAFAADRDAVLQQVAAMARRESGPVIVAGDLNATPWSHAMQPLVAAGLRDTQLGRGFSATWQRNIPIFAIPIDHLLLGGNIAASARWTGPDLGSDHHPVIADLRL